MCVCHFVRTCQPWQPRYRALDPSAIEDRRSMPDGHDAARAILPRINQRGEETQMFLARESPFPRCERGARATARYKWLYNFFLRNGTRSAWFKTLRSSSRRIRRTWYKWIRLFPRNFIMRIASTFFGPPPPLSLNVSARYFCVFQKVTPRALFITALLGTLQFTSPSGESRWPSTRGHRGRGAPCSHFLRFARADRQAC